MADDYLGAAPARTQEAVTLYRNQQFHGAIYLAGYIVECWIKEYMDRQQINWRRNAKDPVTGRSLKHNLQYLLNRSGLGPTIFAPVWENRFVTTAWEVDMRYRPNDFSRNPTEAQELFKAALRVAGNIKRRVI